MSLRKMAQEAKRTGQQPASAASLASPRGPQTPYKVTLIGKEFPVGSAMVFRILDYTTKGVTEIPCKTYKVKVEPKKGPAFVTTRRVPIPTLASSQQLAIIDSMEVGFVEDIVPGTKDQKQVRHVTFAEAYDTKIYRVPVAIVELKLGEQASDSAKDLAKRVADGPVAVYLELSSQQFGLLSPAVQAQQSEKENLADPDKPVLTVDQLDLGSLGMSLPYAFRVVAVPRDVTQKDSPFNKEFRFKPVDVPTSNSDKARDEFAWMDEYDYDLPDEEYDAILAAARTDNLSLSDWEWTTGLRLGASTRPTTANASGSSAGSTRRAAAVAHQAEEVEEEDVFDDAETYVEMTSHNPQTDEVAQAPDPVVEDDDEDQAPPKRRASRWSGNGGK